MDQTTAKQELAAIRSLMAESQAFLCGTWRHQLVWGLIAAVGLTATWWGVRSDTPGLTGWVWALALGAGWVFSLSRSRRRRRAPVRNVATRAFGGIWLALGVTLTLMGVVTLVSASIDPRSLPGLLALVLGGGYFASGFLAGTRWLAGVGVAWWLAGVGLLFMPGPDTLLVLAGLAVVLEVGPALLLRRLERSRAVG